MKLEEELGVRLFDRLGRSVRLTGFGQVFLPRARAILGELKAAKEEVAERQSSVSGPVNIGVIPTIAPYFLPLPLALFSRKYPQSTITVSEDVTARLMDRLRAGQIDLAILAMPLRGHDVETFNIRTERLFAIFPRAHRMAKKRKVMLKELRDQPFLLLREDHCFRDTAIEVCKRARIMPHIVFESGQFSSILAMVGAGLGISLVPAMAVEERSDCAYVPVGDDRAARTIGVVTLRGRYLSRVQHAFLAHLHTFSQKEN
jgi:LysR family hydrogen peroxide-inducible transcriptional activator